MQTFVINYFLTLKLKCIFYCLPVFKFSFIKVPNQSHPKCAWRMPTASPIPITTALVSPALNAFSISSPQNKSSKKAKQVQPNAPMYFKTSRLIRLHQKASHSSSAPVEHSVGLECVQCTLFSKSNPRASGAQLFVLL